MESAREHAERDRGQDTDERGIHGAALTLRIGRRLWRVGINKESRPRQRQDEHVELPFEPVDPGVRLTMVGSVLGAEGRCRSERSRWNSPVNTPSKAVTMMPMSVAAIAGSTGQP